MLLKKIPNEVQDALLFGRNFGSHENPSNQEMKIKHVCSEHLYHRKSYCVKQKVHKGREIIRVKRYTGKKCPCILKGLVGKLQLLFADFAPCHIFKEICYCRVIQIGFVIID